MSYYVKENEKFQKVTYTTKGSDGDYQIYLQKTHGMYAGLPLSDKEMKSATVVKKWMPKQPTTPSQKRTCKAWKYLLSALEDDLKELNLEAKNQNGNLQ